MPYTIYVSPHKDQRVHGPRDMTDFGLQKLFVCQVVSESASLVRRFPIKCIPGSRRFCTWTLSCSLQKMSVITVHQTTSYNAIHNPYKPPKSNHSPPNGTKRCQIPVCSLKRGAKESSRFANRQRKQNRAHRTRSNYPPEATRTSKTRHTARRVATRWRRRKTRSDNWCSCRPRTQ